MIGGIQNKVRGSKKHGRNTVCVAPEVRFHFAGLLSSPAG